MNKALITSVLFTSTAVVWAHPMGNFSVNHYAKFTLTPNGVDLEYVLDLAEIPTFELLREWNLDRNSPREELASKAAAESKAWLSRLEISENGRPLHYRFERSDFVIADGAGDLPIIRITAHARLDAHGGALRYEDHNYPDRAGWKEIVIHQGAGAVLAKASQGDRDLSKALTAYPPDPTLAPPQDLRAELEWHPNVPVIAKKMPATPSPVIAPISQPKSAPAAPSPATLTKQAAPPGSVVRGDFLSKLLHERQITPWMMLVAILAAFVLGAAHALTPGHGKTIVAAYLVGSRGTLKHAAFLGAMVTFTHTFVVFALGLATLFLFRYIMPEKITQVLGAISGLSIVGIGAWMLYKRMRNKPAHTHSHSHDHAHVHSHAHDHSHHHDHPHAHDHVHSHTHAHADGHHHGPGGHTHMPDELSWAGLVALGASGGLVPCESALVLLLSAVALGRAGFGLLLLISFSLGLALVLMGIGILVLYAKNLIPERRRTGNNPLFRWVPVASAAFVVVIGLLMTAVSLGWIQPRWMIA